MKEADYHQWLENRDYQEKTIKMQIYRARRVEKFHGDLDTHYDQDRMADVIEELKYSKDDRRSNRANPSKIPFKGDIYNNLASYRRAAVRYEKFRDEIGDGELETPGSKEADAEEVPGQRMGLERDLQIALRSKIEQLEPGLTVIDDGAERSVDSGFIDITARDSSGATIVIELKAGVAGQRAVAQILSYMGDVAEEDSGVRGILVASGFDAKALAASRMVPSLILRKYSVRFAFSDA